MGWRGPGYQQAGASGLEPCRDTSDAGSGAWTLSCRQSGGHLFKEEWFRTFGFPGALIALLGRPECWQLPWSFLCPRGQTTRKQKQIVCCCVNASALSRAADIQVTRKLCLRESTERCRCQQYPVTIPREPQGVSSSTPQVLGYSHFSGPWPLTFKALRGWRHAVLLGTQLICPWSVPWGNSWIISKV